MGLGDDARRLAKQSYLFEEFIAGEMRQGTFKLDLSPIAQKALLHGHCHQKAFDLMQPMKDVLSLVPGLEVEAIESSCCGMAGSFGYEKEHYDVSMKMAEASLLPAVREAPDDALVIADGTSCRHQISDGVGRKPLHVARVLRRAMKVERT